MVTLNVGCGSDPWGDIHVDISFTFLGTNFKPTVLADAHYLPFKDGSFEIVKASHVLEHLRNPFKALDEMMRVTTENMILSFPTELDILPFFIPYILPIPHLSALKMAYLTRKKRLHLWIINPQIVIDYLNQKGWNGSFKTGRICLFAWLESGSKAKFFRWLTKHVRVPCQYIIVVKKSEKTW